MAHIDEKRFRKALEALNRGVVPDNLDDVEKYTSGTTLELFDYLGALSECVKRQNNNIKVLREMNRKLDENLRMLRAFLGRSDETETKEEEKQ